MSATGHGPAEHIGAYRPDVIAQLEGTEPQWSDAPAECETPEPELDTSGLSREFCPSCLHEPCVAGGVCYCEHPPRIISTTTVALAISKAADAARAARDVGALWVALRTAVARLEGVAWTRGFEGEAALNSLAYIQLRLDNRAAVRAQGHDQQGGSRLTLPLLVATIGGALFSWGFAHSSTAPDGAWLIAVAALAVVLGLTVVLVRHGRARADAERQYTEDQLNRLHRDRSGAHHLDGY